MGISGDMNLAALIDAGVDCGHVNTELKKLGIDGVSIRTDAIMKNGLRCLRAEVGTVAHAHSHSHIHEHAHRSFRDIRQIIEGSSLKSGVKQQSIKIFTLLAKAEGKIHGKEIDDVHFHEIGSVDSIADIVGAAVCIEFLQPDKIISTPVELGGGTVKCAHGTLPVPAPATAEILRGIPVTQGRAPFELTTPTGAAIIAAYVQSFSPQSAYTIQSTGYGAGSRDLDEPNILRVFIGSNDEIQNSAQASNQNVTGALNEQNIMISCAIDDMNPEIYPYVIETLFASGALDVYISPVIMKKGRPGATLNVLCAPEHTEELKNVIFSETTTAGVRSWEVAKTSLKRDTIVINTKYGEIRFKKIWNNGKLRSAKPEYMDCQAAAKKYSLPVQQIIHDVSNEFEAVKNNQ